MVIIKLLSLTIGVGLNITGSYYLARCLVKSEHEIGSMSSTFWGYNPVMESILRDCSKRGIKGISFLIPGIILQIVYAIMEIIISSRG